MSDKKKFQKDKKYRAVIIGAGRIAAQFDDVKSKNVLTHAHAYHLNPQVSLAGIFDIDFSKASLAAKRWETRSYEDFDKMFREIRPEIVSICTPDDQHFFVLRKILKYRPKIVICEKPITTKIADTEKIIKLYKKNKIPILVNYSRRFDGTVQKLKKELARGKYGKVIAATGIYSKGILHNGSHLIDLARYLFGKFKMALSLLAINDYDRQDKTVAGFLQFNGCPQFHLLATDQRHFTMFELDIICERARFRFVNEGFWLMTQSIEPDPVFAGYKVLSAPKRQTTQLDNAMSKLVNNAVEHLNNCVPLICTVEDALEAQKICFNLLKKYV